MVLLQAKNGSIYECDLILQILYSIRPDQEETGYLYEITLGNPRLLSGERIAALENLGQPGGGTAPTSPSFEQPEKPEVKSAYIASDSTFRESTLAVEEVRQKPSPQKSAQPAAKEVHKEEADVDFGLKQEEDAFTPEDLMNEMIGRPKKPAANEPLPVFNFDSEETPGEEAPQIALKEESPVQSPTAPEAPQLQPEQAETEEERMGVHLVFSDAQNGKTAEAPTKAAAKTLNVDVLRASKSLGLDAKEVEAIIGEFSQTFTESGDAIEALLMEGDLDAIHAQALILKNLANYLHLEDLSASLVSLQKSTDLGKARAAWDETTRNYGKIALDETAALPTPPDEQQEAFSLTTDVTAGYPNFNPKEASEALGLPEDLIIEFAHDFIQQAETEKSHFESAYANEELKAIQNYAHKLKGVAANLRIEEIRKTLESLQQNSTLDQVPELLSRFYTQMKHFASTLQKENV